MESRISVTKGNIGWANPDTRPQSGLVLYGPGGRWEGGPNGDIISDRLAEDDKANEGSPVLVVAARSRFDSQEFYDELAPYLERCIEAYERGERGPEYEG